MSSPPNLLNDDGSASMASVLLMSHHAFRRDIARFAEALPKVTAGDLSRAGDLRDEWLWYRGALHGHHDIEDTRIFPSLRAQNETLAPIIDRLTGQHRLIDPLLERGDRAFADLSRNSGDATTILGELGALLADHLALEEAQVVGFLRGAHDFPAPANDAEAELFAQGFAWSSHGVAQDVLERVYAMLPENLALRLPAARAAFDERCVRVWGTAAAGASRTAVPDR